MNITGKRVLLGITGGIAAYKIPELVRLLKKQGAEVQVVLSQSAAAFVTPLTLEALSGHPTWGFDALEGMAHIDLARWADIVVIAPATANILSTLAAGRADDLMSSLCLAAQVPIAVAPAMNRFMWEKPAVQRNLQQLNADGFAIWGPAMGEQACGDIGPGRMLEPEVLLKHIQEVLLPEPQSTGPAFPFREVVITAGPTFEAIDPVRFIGNRSSGKMGFALAEAAKEYGANVTLISGPTVCPAPEGIRCISVQTASEMLDAVMTVIPSADLFIAAAAVADYRPSKKAEQKIKKTEEDYQIILTRNPDILATVAGLPNAPACLGFAAETGDSGPAYAQEKRVKKQIDWIAYNAVDKPGIGFDSPDNALTLYGPKGMQVVLPKAKKKQIAKQLLNLIADEKRRR